MTLCRMKRYVTHKQRPNTGPLQQVHFLPSRFSTPFSLMFIFQNVHCYRNIFILLVLARHMPYLQSCELWTQSTGVPASHSRNTPLNAISGHIILQWTVVTTAALMFNYLTAGACNQQRSKVKEWGGKKT
jgi:hypothetical protein